MKIHVFIYFIIYLFIYLLASYIYVYSILFYTVICSSLYFLFRYSHVPPLERLEQHLGRNGRWRVKCWRPSKASDPPWNTSRAAAKPLRWGSASPKIWAAWSKKLYIIFIYIYIHILVGGLEHEFYLSIQLGIIIPTDFHIFQSG